MSDIKITPELIDHIAKVSRLKLSAEEKKEFENDFKDVLNAFSIIDEFDEDIKVKTHPTEIDSVLRDDKVIESLSQEEALRNTTKKKDGFFVGPKVI